MKKYIYIVLALASVMCACSRDEESIFDKSASERAQEALDNANEVLVAPENGWEMLYFANPASRGNNIIMKFDANGRITATAKNSETTRNKMITDSTSTWQVKLDYGPILTFDTYNEVFHAWADPQSDGDGLLGDYEFLILHAEADYIKLKGKKHGAYCYMYPLEAGETAETYFAEIEASQSKLFGGSNLLRIVSNTEEYYLYAGGTGIFQLAPIGQTPNSEDLEIYPVAVRAKGIQCMVSPRALGDTKFDLKDGVLVGGASCIMASAPQDYINEYILFVGGGWSIDIKDVCDSVKNVIATIDEKLKEAYPKNKSKASVQSLTLKTTSKGLTLVFSYFGSNAKSETTMNYLFGIEKAVNDIKLVYIEPADENAQKTIQAFPDIEVLFNTLSSTYSPVATEAINPSKGIRLINISNPELWCNITGKI